MENIKQILKEINIISAFVRLTLALILGGIIGIDRERKGRSAGFRTYMLVCVGATMVMITNQYIVEIYGTGDPSRMGAQVVSGIGFLGAGTIMVTGKNKVKGLTTAAGLWASACVGLTVGVGFYEGAVLGCITIYIAMSLMHGLSQRVKDRRKDMYVYIEFYKASDLGLLLEYIKYHQFKVLDLELINSEEDEEIVAGLFNLSFDKKIKHIDAVKILRNADCIKDMKVY